MDSHGRTHLDLFFKFPATDKCKRVESALATASARRDQASLSPGPARNEGPKGRPAEMKVARTAPPPRACS
jgi:hypothetical protein